MFCGPVKATGKTVEAVDIHDGYFGYMCMSRAMQKHPGSSGYLLIGDDVILNYWNLVGLKRDHIWEGPKAPKGNFRQADRTNIKHGIGGTPSGVEERAKKP